MSSRLVILVVPVVAILLSASSCSWAQGSDGKQTHQHHPHHHPHGVAVASSSNKNEPSQQQQPSVRGVIRVPKQVGSSPGGAVQSEKDHEQSGTHFGHHGHHGHGFGHHGHGLGHGHHGHHGDGKYFQYAHNPAYDEYEFGYRRGNDYHFQERYERGGPYWNFKTKVKWGDKYAGYGEHYWDYNHQDKGHHGHDGHGHGHGHGGDDGGHGHYSENVATYDKPGHGGANNKITNKRQSTQGVDGAADSAEDAVKVKGEEALPTFSSLRERKYKSEARNSKSEASAGLAALQAPGQPLLTLNPVNGQVTDEATGKTYLLKPTN